MQVSTAQAAAVLKVSRRAASNSIREAGFVEAIGNAYFVDSLALQMADRARADGRRWSAETALAAFDLLDRGATDRLRADARSKLRRQLRAMGAVAIAHRARGILGRIRRVSAPRGTRLLEERADVAAMSALGAKGLLELGLHGGEGGERYLRLAGGESREDLVRAGVVDDANGDIVLFAGATGDGGVSRALIESFLVGDTRVMRAAGDAIAGRARAL